MVKLIERILSWLYPSFLKRVEHWLLLRNPGLWGIRLPAILYFGLVFNLLAIGLVWIYPLDLRSIPPFRALALTFLVFSIIFMVVWLVASARFDPLQFHGDQQRRSTRLRTLVYLLATALFFGPAGTIYFQFQIRLGNYAASKEVAKDLLLFENYSDFLAGNTDTGNHEFFVSKALGHPYEGFESVSPKDSARIWKTLVNLNNKYSYEQVDADFLYQEYQYYLRRQRSDGPFSKGMQMEQSEQRQIVQELTHASYNGPDPILSSTRANMNSIYDSLNSLIFDEWLSWLLNMSTVGIFLAFFIATIDLSVRFLGSWHTLITLIGCGALGYCFLILAYMLGQLFTWIAGSFIPEGSQVQWDASLNDWILFLPATLIGLAQIWLTQKLVIRESLVSTFRTRLFVSLLPAAWMVVFFPLLHGFTVLMDFFPAVSSNLQAALFFCLCLPPYLIAVPSLKKAFYQVYLLPRN